MTEQIAGKPLSALTLDANDPFDNCIKYANHAAANGKVWETFQGFSEANRILVTEGIKDSWSAMGRGDIGELAITLFCFAADSSMALFQEHLVVPYAVTQYLSQKLNKTN